jgi:hypothetical protein
MLRVAQALLVSSLLVSTAAAQGPGNRFAALLVGATLSDLDGLARTSDSRWGGTAGIALGYNSWRTAIALEGNWIQKGGEGVRLTYIELPLTVGAVVVMGQGSMRGRIYSGVSAAFKVGCSSDLLDCDQAEGTEWGLPIGIQLATVRSNGGFVGVDVRYSFPLSDAFEGTDIENRTWQFRLMLGKTLGS